ncbi:MAG TPA: V-type ATP synthase subunit E [Spirochaetaceae bacterium]|jgi:V/A-type H+-transporting ATPase subunit E|nr:V-type ATP synthase subunit E [Spirochaetaceae bacterium]
MDIRVQELLDKIKRDGVEHAEAEAAKIRAGAEEARAAILEAAKKEAKAIVDKAKADAARDEASGRAALKQASRDLVLAFRGEVEKALGAIVRADVEASFNAETLKKALPGILEAWAKDGRDELAVLVPEKDLEGLNAYFKDKLAAQFKKGVELKPLKNSKAGFRISEKDGAAYYDFSAEAVAGMLGAYLNAQLAAIMAEAAE